MPVPLKENLRKHASGVWQQELQIRQGEIVFIKAPSGTGKTTLMHMLYGLRHDFEGSILWDEQNISKLDAAAMAHLRATFISIVFQDMRLFPELTAWENLEVKRVITNTATEESVEHMLQRLGMLHKKYALAKTLSYGEQQRIAIIRSLLQPFDWLLMDEPFSHLDDANIDKATALISEVVANNKAGLLLADLEDNPYFPYHKTLLL